MTTPESKLKSDIKTYLKENGIYWCMIQGGAFSKPGDPDIVACVNGVFLAIEGKTYEGSLRPMQVFRRQQIEASGGIYIVARTVDDVKKVVESVQNEEEQDKGRWCTRSCM